MTFMAMTTLPIHIMGFRVMGDVGGYTCYTNAKFKKVYYPKSPPDKPASPAQRALRDRFAAAVRAWKSLSADDKQALEDAVHSLSLCLTGQNLYTSCCLRSSEGIYQTIARQANVTLPPLVTLP